MNTLSSPKISLFAILFTLFGLTSCKSQFDLEVQSQKEGKNAKIHLLVDADKLFDEPNLNLEFCAMWDGKQKNLKTGTNIKEFYSDVFRGNLVTWQGSVDSDSRRKGYRIKILQIEILDSNCAFDKTILPGKSGKVIGKVRKNGPEDCQSRYAIWFELENEDNDTRVFRLDPWILVRR
jgi:hypothetical protein